MLRRYSFSYNSQIKCFRVYVDTDIFLVLVRGTRAQNLSTPFSYTLYSDQMKLNTITQTALPPPSSMTQ
jgi:hypothetical protein